MSVLDGIREITVYVQGPSAATWGARNRKSIGFGAPAVAPGIWVVNASLGLEAQEWGPVAGIVGLAERSAVQFQVSPEHLLPVLPPELSRLAAITAILSRVDIATGGLLTASNEWCFTVVPHHDV